MLSDRPTEGKRLVAAAALAAFVLMAVGSGCRGFFINQPNSVAVTTGINGTGNTTFSITTQNGTVQLFATAAYSDGSNKDVTKSATWQSSTACAPVTAGLVKGIGNVSSATVTATLAGVSGSATGSVTGATSQNLTITAPTVTASSTGQFTATFNGSDVTSSSTWSSDNTSAVSFSTTTPGFATFGSSGTSANVTASLVQGSTCATGTLAVSIP